MTALHRQVGLVLIGPSAEKRSCVGKSTMPKMQTPRITPGRRMAYQAVRGTCLHRSDSDSTGHLPQVKFPASWCYALSTQVTVGYQGDVPPVAVPKPKSCMAERVGMTGSNASTRPRSSVPPKGRGFRGHEQRAGVMSNNRDWSWKPDRETSSWLKQAETKRSANRQVKKAAKMARKRRNKIIRQTVAKYATPKASADFYHSWEWKKLRYEVLKAYGAVCMCCNSVERIVVDHIKPKRRHPELALSFENMQVLCDDCNRGKSYDDETDFRPKKPLPELFGEQADHMQSILQ